MTRPAASRRHLPSSPFKALVEPPVREFGVGDRVNHDEHGLGRVVGVEEGVAVLVDFGSVRRRVLSPYSRMVVL
ncbi:hypothetical protein BX286_1567 [Streptomyces sp. 3211.6]|uniref:hypothetical protein n=1 Tax=Streptomyces TaxID=1883 RepID=UPI0009A4F121|nr:MULTISPECIES: hypothetical protein [Streptomyces]RKT03637.1 hypothetical protein BX286_1567 [Streptomyces sp. 3211.6]RPF39506.1 hypothetical protein EDD96_3243 [Streptomyces sp. Ag109_G2-6]